MKSAQDEYSSLGNQVKEGVLSFKEFDRLTKNESNWKQYFNTLMIFAEMTEEMCVERMKQIKVYKSLNNIKKIIEILMEIKEKNDLTGEFKVLDEMNASVSLKICILSRVSEKFYLKTLI